MAYNKEQMIKDSIEAIKKYNLMFIEEIFAYVSFSRATFYNWKLDNLDDIKNAFSYNRIKTKAALRKKWYDSENFSAQIALYKLIGTEHEYERLANAKQTVEQTNTNVNIEITEKEAAAIKKALENDY